jgi:hypothetical protein
MAEALAIIEDGNNLGNGHEQPDRRGVRLRQGQIFREFAANQLKHLGHLGRVGHRVGTRRHGQAFDAHRVARVVVDDKRDAVIGGDIDGLLALPAAQEVEHEALAGKADGRRLRPAVRPHRRHGHDSVLGQQPQDRLFVLGGHGTPSESALMM